MRVSCFVIEVSLCCFCAEVGRTCGELGLTWRLKLVHGGCSSLLGAGGGDCAALTGRLIDQDRNDDDRNDEDHKAKQSDVQAIPVRLQEIISYTLEE